MLLFLTSHHLYDPRDPFHHPPRTQTRTRGASGSTNVVHGPPNTSRRRTTVWTTQTYRSFLRAGLGAAESSGNGEGATGKGATATATSTRCAAPFLLWILHLLTVL